MSKTPYEIRLDLLRMAKEIHEADYFASRDTIIQGWNSQVDLAASHNEKKPAYPDLPAFPAASEIMKTASQLNGFISNG